MPKRIQQIVNTLHDKTEVRYKVIKELMDGLGSEYCKSTHLGGRYIFGS